MKNEKDTIKQPISLITVNRFLVAVIVILAFLAGYFHAKVGTLEKKLLLLEQATVAQ